MDNYEFEGLMLKILSEKPIKNKIKLNLVNEPSVQLNNNQNIISVLRHQK